jgi:hypothetical protein
MCAGANIISTIPGGLHAQQTGTSQASPHIVAVAAQCYMKGLCTTSQTIEQRIAVIRQAAIDMRTANAAYGFVGDAAGTPGTTPRGEKYYGYMVHAWQS